jgi:diguanylate cyclase (GGDEF)-like protein/PAS domain S-box-containing protein
LIKNFKYFLPRLCLLGFCLFAQNARALEQVSLELRWFHQFQFAGYYAALEKGFYRDAGLDVTLKEGGPGANPVQGVLSGRSEFGIALSSLVVNYLKGDPVLVLGPIFQHSPNILLVRGHDKRLVDLVVPQALPIAVMGADQDVDLKSMFINEGIAVERLRLVADENHLEDLKNNRVAALNAYVSNEPYLLDRLGMAYTILKPSTYGLDFYGDVLFTRQGLEKAKPQLVAAFYAASKRGWEYALAHPEEITDLIVRKYNTQGKSRDHLLYEARALHGLINPEVIDIGHNNPARWRHIARTYASFGLVNAEQSLDNFFYTPERQVDLAWVYWLLASFAGVTLLVGAIAFYIHRANLRLAVAIAEKIRTEEALKKSEEWHRIVFETSPSAGIVWWPGFVVVAWNRQAEVLFGWRREDVVGRPFDQFLMPEVEKSEFLPRLYCESGENAPQLLPHSINRNLTRDGRTITCEWFNSWLPECPGEPRSIISLATDITERQRLEEQIHHLAFYDPLTALPNRRLLHDRFELVVAGVSRNAQYGALLFIDLDNFKPLNDQHGHEAGDQLLIDVSRRLQGGVRGCDTVARFGGDEFIVLLGGLNVEQPKAVREAEAIAGKLLEYLTRPYVLNNAAGEVFEHCCSASIGIALFDGQSKADEILRSADNAMYRAKKAGRKQCCTADPESSAGRKNPVSAAFFA